MNLTNEEIRIKVHEALGWTKRMEGPTHYAWSRGDYWHYLHEVPNYPESLDACAEFRKTLTDTEKERYAWWLNFLHPSTDIHYTPSEKHIRREVFDLIDAEPILHCLAYLKTKGLIP